MCAAWALAASALLAGCASFSEDGGFGPVRQMTQERTGQAPAWNRTAAEADETQARVADLLKAPLTADAAVEIALLNNRGLQAEFAALGIADADRVRAGRLPNPSFRFGHLSGGGDAEIDRGVMLSLVSLLTLPIASQVEQRRLEQTQLKLADAAVGLAADTRRAYFRAVAARQLVAYDGQVMDAAEAANELARRLAQAGNFSTLAQMREQAFHADATARLIRGQHRAIADRERLVRLLGLDADQARMLPERLAVRLPDLPDRPTELQNAEQTAMTKRLDVLMARRAADTTAQSLGLTRATRMINVFDVGYANKSQAGQVRTNGYEIELELPLFDFGSTRVARAEATYMAAVNRTADVALRARSEVRESYSAYRATFEVARHYRDEVVPLRKRISDENLLRYNGMLISVFDLLADARDQIAAVSTAIEALRDHWIAQTDLQTALTGRSPGASSSVEPGASSTTTGPSAAAH